MEARLAGRLPAPAAEPAGDGDAEWPDEQAEAAFLSEAGGSAATVVPAPDAAAPRAPAGPALPDLESLVAQVPPHLASLLDDLFRARFTAVRRVAADKAAATS